MKDKYNISKEQNIFLAKRNIVDTIWKSANLEGIPVTFPETQQIYDGGNVAHLRVDEIVTINNLKHAWEFLFSTLDSIVDFNYISSINSLVGSSLIESPGKIRIYEVKMAGTKWMPKIPIKEDLENLIISTAKIESETERILTFMCKLMKLQLFNDGNKRTSLLIANHELIRLGHGIISIAQEDKVEFGTKLIEYYEDEEKLQTLVKFLYDKCLYGIDRTTN